MSALISFLSKQRIQFVGKSLGGKTRSARTTRPKTIGLMVNILKWKIFIMTIVRLRAEVLQVRLIRLIKAIIWLY